MLDAQLHSERPMGAVTHWDESATLIDYIDRAFERFAQLPAYAQQGHSLTYRELVLLSRRVASYLQHCPDLVKGDRIAVQMPNSLLYPVIALGVMQAGMILVNTNPLYTERETLRQLKDADVRAWFCSHISAHLISKARKELKCSRIIIARLFDLHPFFKRSAMHLHLRFKTDLIRPYSRRGTVSFRHVLRVGGLKAWRRPELNAKDLALLQYTGGASGVHKGAMLSHGNLVANIEQIAEFLKHSLEIGKEVLLAPLPIYHIFSFTVHCAAPLLMGSLNVMIMDATHMSSLIKEMSTWKPTCITGVNTLFHGLMRFHSFRHLDFSKLKFAIAGGMKLDPKVAEAWETLTGAPILEGFGMTELSPVASWNPPTANRLGTIGIALPLTEMRLIDQNEQIVLQPNTHGELQVRGPQLMQGYWNKPGETQAQISHDGWLYTGDLASFDADGYWQIVGRKKKMILVSGFNVYPQEIEEVLKLHPDVTDCRAIGVWHPVNGESIKVQLVSSNKTIKAQDIRAFCKKHLVSYKMPKHIEFHDDLTGRDAN